MTAVLPAVNPKNGDVLAMAASKTYGAGRGQTEQPIFTAHVANGASTYKLFPLLAALQMGVPNDWPLQTVGNSGKYTTKYCAAKSKSSNGDANVSYNAQETLTTATAKSSNTYFVGLADNLFECQLTPMVSLAQHLGMTALDQPSPDLRNQTIGQEIESAAARAAVRARQRPDQPAGAGRRLRRGRQRRQVQRAGPDPVDHRQQRQRDARSSASPAVQVIAPQAAANALEILTGDTKSGNDGTSVGKFQNWYNAGGSDVAGKTGTVAAVSRTGKETSKNAAVWFVGVTKNLAATSALINFDSPNSASTGLPGIGSGKAYGDYASGLWLKAFGSQVHQRWILARPEQRQRPAGAGHHRSQRLGRHAAGSPPITSSCRSSAPGTTCCARTRTPPPRPSATTARPSPRPVRRSSPARAWAWASRCTCPRRRRW